MKLLVEYPHDDCSFLNLTDDYQRTPLMWACCEDDEECALYLVDMLLKHDIPEINKVAFNGKTPLRKAALIGHRNVVERLLTLSTEDKDIDAEDFLFHRRALHAAAYRGHHEIVEMLISAGSDVAKPDRDGNTPLMRCYQGWAAGDYTGSEDTLEILIDKHSAAAIADKELMSLVAFKGSWRIMDQLLKLGANPNERDSHGWKPIQILRRYKNSKEHAQMEYILDQYEAKFGKLPALWAKTKGITIDPQNKLQFHSDGFGITFVLFRSTPTNDKSRVHHRAYRSSCTRRTSQVLF
jgi:ankyrin repeat protein